MEQEQSNQPMLCRNGCGFYGSPATDGMCSQCYKDCVKRKNSSQQASGRVSPNQTNIASSSNNSSSTSSSSAPSEPSAAAITTTTTTTTSISLSSNAVSGAESESIGATASLDDSQASPTTSAASSSGGSSDEKDGLEKKTKKRNRCYTCRKKVGLTGFECRCGGLFCSIHRYSDKHECTFDYRAEGQEQIRKNNPVIVGEKIQKI